MLGVLGASVAIHRCAGRSAGNHKTRWETRQGGGREAAPRGVRASRRADRRCQLGPPPPLDRDAHIHICGLRSLWALRAARPKTQKVIRGACGFVATLCEVCPCMYYLPEPCEHVTAHRGRFGSPGDPAPARGRASRGTTTHEERIGLDSASTRDARRSETAPATRGGAARERESASHMHPERETACEGTTPW